MSKCLQTITIFMIISCNCLCSPTVEKELQNNSPFPKIVWTYSQVKNYDQNVMTKIGSENIKFIQKNWQFRHLDNSNVFQVLSQIPKFQQMLRFPQYNMNNKPIIPIDLIRITLLKNFGGVFIDYDAILSQSLQWINNIINETFTESKLTQNSQIYLLDKYRQQIIYYYDQKNKKDVLLYPSFDTYFIASQKQSVFMNQWFDYYTYAKDIFYQKYKNSQQSWFKDLANQYGIQIQQIIKSKYAESIICAQVLLRKKQIELDKLWTSNPKQKYRTLAVSQYKICNINKEQLSQFRSDPNLIQANFGQKMLTNQNTILNMETSLKDDTNNKNIKQKILTKSSQILPLILIICVQIGLFALFAFIYFFNKETNNNTYIKQSVVKNQILKAKPKDQLQFQSFASYEQKQKGQENKENKKNFKKYLIISILVFSFTILQIAIFEYYNLVQQKQIQTIKYIQKPVLKQAVKEINVEKQREIDNKVAKIFPATVKLNYNYENETQPVTVVFTCSGNRFNFFEATLKSFFEKNTYPIRQILAVNDDHYTEQFGKFISKFPNITFILTNLRVGQFYAVDLAYKFIKTEYYFHSEEDFDFIKSGFIQKSLQIMKKQPKISQVVLRSWGNSTDGPEGIIDPKKSLFSAFSFNPSIKRMSEYRLFSQKFGGFSQFLSFKSFGKGAGNTEGCISYYLLKQGFVGYHLTDTYAVHTGETKGLSKFVFGDKSINCQSIIPN